MCVCVLALMWSGKIQIDKYLAQTPNKTSSLSDANIRETDPHYVYVYLHAFGMANAHHMTSNARVVCSPKIYLKQKKKEVEKKGVKDLRKTVARKLFIYSRMLIVRRWRPIHVIPWDRVLIRCSDRTRRTFISASVWAVSNEKCVCSNIPIHMWKYVPNYINRLIVCY